MTQPSELTRGSIKLTTNCPRFIESESDLDSILKQFLPLTQNPALYYPELVKSGTVALLASLLSHENTDIAIDVVQVVQELTDEDVGAQDDTISDEEDDDDDSSATRLALAQFIDALVSMNASNRHSPCPSCRTQSSSF